MDFYTMNLRISLCPHVQFCKNANFQPLFIIFYSMPQCFYPIFGFSKDSSSNAKHYYFCINKIKRRILSAVSGHCCFLSLSCLCLTISFISLSQEFMSLNCLCTAAKRTYATSSISFSPSMTRSPICVEVTSCSS